MSTVEAQRAALRRASADSTYLRHRAKEVGAGRRKERKGEGGGTTSPKELLLGGEHLTQPRLQVPLFLRAERVAHPCDVSFLHQFSFPSYAPFLAANDGRKGREGRTGVLLKLDILEPELRAELVDGRFAPGEPGEINSRSQRGREYAREGRGEGMEGEGAHCTTGSAVPWPWKTLLRVQTGQRVGKEEEVRGERRDERELLSVIRRHLSQGKNVVSSKPSCPTSIQQEETRRARRRKEKRIRLTDLTLPAMPKNPLNATTPASFLSDVIPVKYAITAPSALVHHPSPSALPSKK